MGNLQQKLVQLGQYCDCLQNWKKFKDENDNQSNLYMSESMSQLQNGIQKAFKIEEIDNIFDKQLEEMHNRLKKRKKLKAQYTKQKEQQRLIRHQQNERQQRQRIQRMKKQKELFEQQERVRKQIDQKRKENLFKANKRNKKNRPKNKNEKLIKNDLKINKNNAHNKTLSTTTDQLLLNLNGLKQNFEKAQQTQEEDSIQQNQSYDKVQKINNVFDKVNKSQAYNSSHRKQLSDKDYDDDQYIKAILEKRNHKTIEPQIQIIDLQKLNPKQVDKEISQLLIKNLKDQQQQKFASQSLPLHKKNIKSILSHRSPYDDKQKHIIHKDLLKVQNRQNINSNRQKFGDPSDQISSFAADDSNPSIILANNSNNDYFLDDDDKEQYLKEIFK